MRIAIPTPLPGGVKGRVDEVFSRAPVFTLISLEGQKIRNVQVIMNEAAKFSHGAGPVAVKILKENGVELLFAPEIGIGTSQLLEEKQINYTKVEKGLKVSKIIEMAIDQKSSPL